MRYRVWWFFVAMVFVGALRWTLDVCEAVNRTRRLYTVGQVFDKRLAQSHAYALRGREWITLRVPADANLLRIFTNANRLGGPVASNEEGTLEPEWKYSLRFELSSNQRTIQQGTYHFVSGASTFDDPESGETLHSGYYANSTLLPSGTRAMHLPIGRLSHRPDRLRMRIHSHDPEVQDVCVRIYARQQRHGYERSYTWTRISDQHKRKLARAHVFAPELLSAEERKSLLRWQWSPLAPLGLEGKQFERRTLYSFDVTGESAAVGESAGEGLLIRAGTCGMIPIPRGEGRCDLTIMLNDPNSRQREVTLTWFGDSVYRSHTDRLTAQVERQVTSMQVDGGLIQVAAQADTVVQASWRSESLPDAQDITPETQMLRTYRVDEHEGVAYSVTHCDGQPTPVRVSLRLPALVTDPNQDLGPYSVRWELLDATDNVMESGCLPVDQPISPYDRFTEVAGDFHVTEPQSYCFSVPPEAKTLRILAASSRPCYVAAFTRSSDLSKRTRVPEDYSVFHRLQYGEPVWFMVRPVDHLRLLEKDRSKTVRIQPRPPEADPAIVAGDYQWQGYRPSGAWAGHHFLDPRHPDAPLSETAVHTSYVEIPANEPIDVRWLESHATRDTQPRLIFFKPSEAPTQIRVLLDGKPWRDVRVMARHGQISLPLTFESPKASPTRSKRLLVESAAQLRLFMNGIDPTGQPTYVKRLANRCTTRSLDFEYDKERAEETVTLHFYQARAATAVTPLKVEITLPDGAPIERALGPHASWTLTMREFHFSRDDGELALPLIHGDVQPYRVHRCFIPIGTDLPLGRYRIRVHSESEGSRYMMLSKTTPGTPVRRDMRYELRTSR